MGHNPFQDLLGDIEGLTDAEKVKHLTTYVRGLIDHDPPQYGMSICQYSIFRLLERNLGRVCPHEALYDAVYPSYGCETLPQVISVHMVQVRRKMPQKYTITNIRGVGYKMTKTENKSEGEYHEH